AQSAEEAGDIAEAARLYRTLMKSDPTDASAPFNLGNMLRADGRNVEAEAALRTATRVDPKFSDAWYNLSDLLDEQGRTEPPSSACAQRCGLPLTTPMRCSILPCYYNEQTDTPRPQIPGVAISLPIANPNGLNGRADHSNFVRCRSI